VSADPKAQLKSLEAKFLKWQRDPLLWVQDFFGDALRAEYRALVGRECPTASGLTRDQERATQELGRIVSAKFDQRKGKKLTEKEEWYASRIGISVMSGQGLGKDFWSALMMWWFLAVFPRGKNMATATSAKQLRNVFWSEMSKVAGLSLRHENEDRAGGTVLDAMFIRQSEKIFSRYITDDQGRVKPNDGSEHFLEAVTINTKNSVEEQGEALAGRHEKFMLILADEASGIAEGVFKPLEGTLTGVINLIICIFNPTRSRGYAVETQKDGSPYLALHWDGENSDLEPVLRNRNEMLATKYGRDSNPYRIRVRGLPPLVEADTLIPQDWIEDAVARHESGAMKPQESDPWMVGVDPAAGGDQSVILRRRGGWVDPDIQRCNSTDTMVLVQRVTEALDDCGDRYGCFIDSVGLGKPIYDRLKELGYKRVFPVDVRKRQTEEENPKFDGKRFHRLRDQLWWALREDFEAGVIAIPRDQNLVDQLGCMKWSGEGGIVKISSKKEIKRDRDSLGGGDWSSPDEGDALMHTKAKPDRMFRNAGKSGGKGLDFKGVFMR
jgi:phage terminase large subunit